MVVTSGIERAIQYYYAICDICADKFQTGYDEPLHE